MGAIPPGMGGMPFPGRQPGVAYYPGPAYIYQDPRFQYNPTFDGLYSHGTTNNSYNNYLQENVNAMQHQLFSAAGVGFPAGGNFPPPPPSGMMPPPPGMGMNQRF